MDSAGSPSNLFAVRKDLEQFYERYAIDKVLLQRLNAAVGIFELVVGPVGEGLLLHLDPFLAAAHLSPAKYFLLSLTL